MNVGAEDVGKSESIGVVWSRIRVAEDRRLSLFYRFDIFYAFSLSLLPLCRIFRHAGGLFASLNCVSVADPSPSISSFVSNFGIHLVVAVVSHFFLLQYHCYRWNCHRIVILASLQTVDNQLSRPLSQTPVVRQPLSLLVGVRRIQQHQI